MIEEEKAKKLNDDLRRQLKEEIGDEEGVPEKRMQILRQKFGVTAQPILFTPTEKYWVRLSEATK